MISYVWTGPSHSDIKSNEIWVRTKHANYRTTDQYISTRDREWSVPPFPIQKDCVRIIRERSVLVYGTQTWYSYLDEESME